MLSYFPASVYCKCQETYLWDGYESDGIFGMSPMAYIKIQRLNGVRRALKNVDSGTTSVTELAHQWGFWSPGHFGRDDKKMFGDIKSG